MTLSLRVWRSILDYRRRDPRAGIEKARNCAVSEGKHRRRGKALSSPQFGSFAKNFEAGDKGPLSAGRSKSARARFADLVVRKKYRISLSLSLILATRKGSFLASWLFAYRLWRVGGHRCTCDRSFDGSSGGGGCGPG